MLGRNAKKGPYMKFLAELSMLDEIFSGEVVWSLGYYGIAWVIQRSQKSWQSP
jgi:hypothetical protein